MVVRVPAPLSTIHTRATHTAKLRTVYLIQPLSSTSHALRSPRRSVLELFTFLRVGGDTNAVVLS